MLTTFHATNYKGLQFEELSLGKLNLYVGPNNCGKSNLFSAMSLVWEMGEGGVNAEAFWSLAKTREPLCYEIKVYAQLSECLRKH